MNEEAYEGVSYQRRRFEEAVDTDEGNQNDNYSRDSERYQRNQNKSSADNSSRPRDNDPCPFHKLPFTAGGRDNKSYHLWKWCMSNVHSENFKPSACIKVLNRENAPQWFINECKREKDLSPNNQSQQQQQQQPQQQQQQQQPQRQQGHQYQFGGQPYSQASLPPPFIPAQGGSYVFQPTIQQQQPPMIIPVPGGSYVFQAEQASANQQQLQQRAGGSYMNLPAQARTQTQQTSSYEIRADGTLGWRR